MADLGEGPGPPLFCVKKEEMTEGRKASRAAEQVNQNRALPLGQGLDLAGSPLYNKGNHAALLIAG